MRRKLFSWHRFTHFPKTTAPQQVIFSGKLSTFIIFKLCKLSVNLLTLCFFVLQKLHLDPLNHKRRDQLAKRSQMPFSSTVSNEFHKTKTQVFEIIYEWIVDVCFVCNWLHNSFEFCLIICVWMLVAKLALILVRGLSPRLLDVSENSCIVYQTFLHGLLKLHYAWHVLSFCLDVG